MTREDDLIRTTARRLLFQKFQLATGALSDELTKRTRLCLSCGVTHESDEPIRLDTCPHCEGTDLETLWHDEIPTEATTQHAVDIATGAAGGSS